MVARAFYIVTLFILLPLPPTPVIFFTLVLVQEREEGRERVYEEDAAGVPGKYFAQQKPKSMTTRDEIKDMSPFVRFRIRERIELSPKLQDDNGTVLGN